MVQNNWHAQELSEVLTITASSSAGLSATEAARRLKFNGANEIAVFRRASVFMRFLRQFNNVLIYVLLVSALTTLFLGRLVDTGVILGVVVLNAIFGFIQEGKAEKAIEAIRQLLAPNATVIRDGKYAIIPARTLVPGDIVLIKSGDKIPADLRLISGKNLQIQEAILTGESEAVEKNPAKVAPEAGVSERSCMGYSGTTVTYGKGMGVVVATGSQTEIGKIGVLLKKIQPLTTPLLQQLNLMGQWLTLSIVVLAAITFLIGVFVWHDSIEQMFMSAVGLAVAAIPEGLPPVLTIILAIGVTRMAKRNAITRQLPAVETMGAVTTICTDKTGTLTRNEQKIKNIVTAQASYHINGEEQLAVESEGGTVELLAQPELKLALTAVLLCNDAELSRDTAGQWQLYGNPIDKAFLNLGRQAKINLALLTKEYPRTDLIPYESEHKFMATLHHSHTAQGFIYMKGAPEQVLVRCTQEKFGGTERPLNYHYWYERIEQLARQGYRVIAIATKRVAAEQQILQFTDVAENLTLLAIFGLIDAPREEATQAVAQCYSAGIKVKMITGDHAVTAATIAAQVGIASQAGVLTGSDIDKLSDTELVQVVNDINVYARTSPHHKLRLVNALQTNGELVAMTGDGVNDAPALRQANIGIAMGSKGAEIAKESAAMVLADDNFATIVHAVEEGRIVYDNLKKVLLHILPTNAAEAFAVIMAVILGVILPITPVQILWVNMVTSVTLAIALGFEPAENNVMQRPPRNAKLSILSPFLVWRIVFVTVLFVASVFGLFMWYRAFGVELAVARTIAVNMLVMGETIYLLNCRKLHSSIWNLKTLISSVPVMAAIAAIILLQLLFTYLPLMQHFFATAALTLGQWVSIVGLALGIFVLVELEKRVVRYFAFRQ